MKKFEFRFSAVERVRKTELDLQVKKMVEAQNRVGELQKEYECMHEEMRSEIERFHKLPFDQRIEKTSREISINFRNHLQKKMKEKQAEILEAHHEVVKEKRQVVERKKKKSVLEKLREREEEAYYEEMRRKENVEQDESSANLWIFNRSE